MFKKLNDTSGIGLLEVLISVIILSVGLIMTLPMLITSIDTNTISRDNSVAANLVKQTIEFYENLDSIPTIPDQIYETDVLQKFNRTTVLADSTTDATIPNGVYRIDVNVDWTDFQNVPRHTGYATYILK